MTSEYKRKTMRVPFRVRLRRLMRFGFLLLILGLIPFFLTFMMRDAAATRFNGLVEADSETIGPVETARILSIEVQSGQRVNAGDVLVRLDPADRALDLAMQETRLLDYRQNLLRYEQDLQRYRQTLQESERRSRQLVQEASVAWETEKLNSARDEAELAGLKAEITRLQPLVDKRLVSEIELSKLRPQAQALEQTVLRYAPLIAALQQRHGQAVKDLEEVRSLLAATERAPQAASVTEALQRVTEVLAQAAKSEPAVLRASRAGIVSRLQRQAGDVVVAGEPIVRVASSGSIYINGLLRQSQLAGLAAGDKLQVARLTTGGQQHLLTAQVETLDPEVMDLLDPFNPAPRCPTRGRRVRLRVLEADNRLVPGETVTLQPLRQGSWLDSVRRTCFFSARRASTL